MNMNETIRGMIDITIGWMMDIHKRMGANMSWSLTSVHREFIDFLEGIDETTTFEEYSMMCKRLMAFHAMARNDIYDMGLYLTPLCDGGHKMMDDEFANVKREEKDVRELLFLWHNEIKA
jgi:hypothetical protein